MASNKLGLAYYNVDTDRYQDIRIKRLKKTFSCSGIAIYDYILCEIYRGKGCYLEWDENHVFDIAEYFDIKESLVGEVVTYCCAVGLFNKAVLTSGKVLTSASIQKRYVDMCNRAKRKDIIIPEECRIIPEECEIIPEECGNVPEVCRRVEKSKEEKSREEERKGLTLARQDENRFDLNFAVGEFKELISTWIRHKKEINKNPFKTQMSVEAAFSELMSMAEGNVSDAKKIINHCVANNWGMLVAPDGLKERQCFKNQTNEPKRQKNYVS